MDAKLKELTETVKAWGPHEKAAAPERFAALAHDYYTRVTDPKPATAPKTFEGIVAAYYADRDLNGQPCKKTGGAR